MPARGRLAAYAPWQLLDYLQSAGITAAIIGLLIGAPLYLARESLRMTGPEQAWRELRNPIETMAFLIVLLATQRISAADRTNGFVRFYFAKPVRITTFYLQKFVAVGVGVMLVVTVLVALGLVVGVPIPAAAVLGTFAVTYVVLGGLTFLCSSITRFDWTAAVALWAAAFILPAIVGGYGWPLWPLRVLPPVEQLDGIRGALFAGVAPAASDLAWTLGYGIVAVVLGLLILSRRPLTR